MRKITEQELRSVSKRVDKREPIAVVGIGCRFPGASSPREFWQLLKEGRNAISEVAPARFDVERVWHPRPGTPGRLYVRGGGFLDQPVEDFDAGFFGISPREAERMDPQQRLLLEVVWEAFEDAGVIPEETEETRTGVFVGNHWGDFEAMHIHDSAFDLYTYTGGIRSSLAGRISYVLGFRGPSFIVDTACSTSLVAMHLACKSLWMGECSRAVVGAVNILLMPEFSVGFASAKMLAPDMRCKAFDASGNGFVRAEGVTGILLKPLRDAIADGDSIYAVVLGGATNHDGRGTPYMTPSRTGQMDVLKEAYRDAAVPGERVAYVEAHGTGTVAGDPVEVGALGAMLCAERPVSEPLLLGSVKTNIGHTEGAAGAAGFIKTALILQNHEVPPNLHYNTPNPNIPWRDLAIRVPTQAASLEAQAAKGPLVAGVSSFGISKTNSHIVLAEAPAPAERTPSEARPELLVLSARSQAALDQLAGRFGEYLSDPALSSTLGEITYTAGARRMHHSLRLGVVASSAAQAGEILAAHARGEKRPEVVTGAVGRHGPPKIVFVFPGQGSQWVGMGRGLMEREPVFRDALVECNEAFREFADWDLFEELARDKETTRQGELKVIQPMLFAIEIGLARLWRHWGIEPNAVVGHSMGESAAAHIAGALTLRDAARVICGRSRLMQRLRGSGSMALVELSREEAEKAIAGFQGVSVSVCNSPTQSVIGGNTEVMKEVVAAIEKREIFCRLIKADIASHTPQMEPLRLEILEALDPVRPRELVVPMLSTVIPGFGRRPSDGTQLDASYWWRNLRQPVLFAEAVSMAATWGYPSSETIFIEMSPHPILTLSVQQTLAAGGKPGLGVPSMRREENEREVMLGSLANLFARGANPKVDHVWPRTSRSARLPTYAWQRERLWLEPTSSHGRERGQRPFVHRRLQSADPSSNHYVENTIDIKQFPFLLDHQVEGTVVLPGMGSLEFVLEGVADLLGPGPRTFRDVAFREAVVIHGDRSRNMQLVLSPNDDGSYGFHIYSRMADSAADEPWSLNVTGQIAAGDGGASPTTFDPATRAEVTARLPNVEGAKQFYDKVDALGVGWKARFQGVEEMRSAKGEALARVVTPKALLEAGDDIESYEFHPALLDAVLHSIYEAGPEKGVFMPVKIDRLTIHGRPTAAMWSHSRLRPDSDSSIDVGVYDDDGRQLCDFSGLRLRYLAKGAGAGTRQLLHEMKWVASTPPEGGPSWTSLQPPATWVILADRSDVGRRLAERLREQGLRALVLRADMRPETGSYVRVDEHTVWVRPDSSADLQDLLELELGRGTPPLAGVIHMWSLDVPNNEGTNFDVLNRARLLGCESVVRTLQVLEGLGKGAVPVWLVTAGAQAVEGPPTSVAQSPLWGLGRALSQEEPHRWGGLIDLDPAGQAEDNARRLHRELTRTDGEDQVGFRNGKRYVLRLVRAQARKPTRSFKLVSDATYLVTGGLGDVGLVTAAWLVDKGARNLVLAGRSALPPRDSWDSVAPDSAIGRRIAAVRKLEAKGARVETVSLDVAREGALGALIEQLTALRLPTLRGVAHAAGMVEERLLAEHDPSHLERILESKVAGTWQLHELSQRFPLDFLIFYSSGASILGSPKLGAYGAANAFLDAMAHFRAARGEAALAVNWGPWEGLGMSTLGDSHQGMTSFTPDEAFDIQEKLLRQGATQVACLPIDWKRWGEIYPAFARAPVLAELMREVELRQKQSAAPAAKVSREALAAAEPEAAAAMCADYLRTIVTAITGTPPEKLGRDAALNQIGLDSLMSVDLKGRIAKDLGVTISIVKLLSGLTVHEVSLMLLEQIGRSEPPAPPALTAIQAAPTQRHEPFEMNDLQQAFFMGQSGFFELGNLTANYYAQFAFDDLPIEHVRRGFRRLVERHESLRTVVVQGDKLQVLAQVPELEIPVRDLSQNDAEAAAAAVARTQAEMMANPPRTDQWPLIRVAYDKLPGGRALVHYSMATLICDASSLGILLSDLGPLCRQDDPQLPPLELGLRDYQIALGKLEDTEAYRKSMQYWHDRLATMPGGPEWPQAVEASSIRRPEFVLRRAFVEPTAWERIKQRAQAHGLTPNSVVTSVYAEIAGQWSKSKHFTLNLVHDGRADLHPQAGDLVGNFSSPLLLEVNHDKPEAFVTRTRELFNRMAVDMDHDQVNGVRVLRELNRRRPGVRTMMPVALSTVLKSGDHPVSEWEDSAVFQRIATPQVWINLRVHETRGALDLNTQAVEALFPPDMIADMLEAMVRRFQQLADRDEAWTELATDVLPARQLEVLRDANPAGTEMPATTLARLFAERVRTASERPAVVTSKRTLTYGELEGRSAAVAELLQERGARRNALVAVVMEKGWEQVVAALGVVRAGAAYLPIDPGLPAARLEFLLRNSEVTQVLTQSWLEDRVAWPEGCQRHLVDRMAAARPGKRPNLDQAEPADLAYVIYTSGSTGLPKGVAIEHRAASNTILDVNERFGVGPDDRAIGLSAMTFDLAVWDVFGMLAVGGALVLPDPNTERDPEHWRGLARTHRVTVWNSVPALMAMFAEHAAGQRQSLDDLRLVMLSGDWIPLTLPAQIAQVAPRARVVSLGGATEASIWSIAHPIEAVDPAWASIPYGRALRGQTIHVLDHALEATPMWVPGEIYIGGVGLARGYWRDEEKTRASFVVHPRTKERLYKTGDIGYYVPQGHVVFLGRNDQQVKVQGYRIELGEIEAILAQHPDVRFGVVVAAGTRESGRRLVAYVVPARTDSFNADRVRDHLRAHLPSYMVPSSIVALASLPLSSNGKVDRAALQTIEQSSEPRSKGYVAPSTEIERQLVELWEELMGTKPIGVRDDFFELGGQSLVAVRMMTRIREQFGREFPLTTLFEHGTVEQLARLVQGEGGARSSVLVPIQSKGSRAPLFLVHPVGGNVLCYSFLARQIGGDRPIYGLEARGVREGQPLESVEQMAETYIEAIRTVQPQGPYLIGAWSFGGVVAFEMARRLHAAGQKVDRMVLLDAPAPGSGKRMQRKVDDLSLTASFVADLLGRRVEDLGGVPASVASLPADNVAEALLSAWTKLVDDSIPDLAPEQLRRLLAVYKANTRAGMAYAPEPHAVDITLLRARAGLITEHGDPMLGWSDVCRAKVSVVEMEGDHYGMLTPKQVGDTARKVGVALGE